MDQVMTDVFRWDVINWSRHVEVWEDAIGDWGAIGETERGSRPLGLELGSDWGGGLSLWMALKGFDVISSHYDTKGWITPDDSYAREARRVQAAYAVTGHVRFERVDVLEMDFYERFDIIMAKSVLGGLGR